MTYSPFNNKPRTWVKWTLIIGGIILFIGAASYGAMTLLKSVATIAPSPATSKDQQTAIAPADALKVANAAKASAIEKVASGKQDAALADYQTAYNNYKLAGNTGAANDMLFAVNSIKAVLAVQKNPAKPDSKTSSK